MKCMAAITPTTVITAALELAGRVRSPLAVETVDISEAVEWCVLTRIFVDQR